MSSRSERMRAVVAAVAPDLKAAGFRKRRHSFNRSPGRGVVHVIEFQMAPYRVPPGMAVPPGLVDGSFRINLGVYDDALVREDWERPKGKWVNEYECQVRVVIGELLQGQSYDRRAVDPSSGTIDIWWSLADVELATNATRSALGDHALSWLDRLASEQAAIEHRAREERTNAEIAALVSDDLKLLGIDPDAGRRISERMARYDEDHPGSEP